MLGESIIPPGHPPPSVESGGDGVYRSQWGWSVGWLQVPVQPSSSRVSARGFNATLVLNPGWGTSLRSWNLT